MGGRGHDGAQNPDLAKPLTSDRPHAQAAHGTGLLTPLIPPLLLAARDGGSTAMVRHPDMIPKQVIKGH